MRIKTLLLMAVAGLFAAAPIVQANGLQAQMHLGRMWTNPENDGAESPVSIKPIAKEGNFGNGLTSELKRGWVNNGAEKQGSYLFTTDWTDPAGTAWDDAGSYMFRSF